MTVRLTVDGGGLVLTGVTGPPGRTLSLLLSGRPIWSFRIPATGESGAVVVPWPDALARRLTGRADLSVAEGQNAVSGTASVRFDDEDVELADELVDETTGSPLVVNKWGRLSRTFADATSEFIDDVLDASLDLVRDVERTTGIRLFVTGGTLLGPIRDGRIMPDDDDADLAYLSEHENPSDVALESYRLEEALVGTGREVIRLSAGHLQIMFPGGTVQDRFYIDIFSYFVVDGLFYGTFHACAPREEVPLLPLGVVIVNGRSLPAPAEPRKLLTAIYGESWHTPDPAFTFDTPPHVLRRYRGWLADYNEDRELWEDAHRASIASLASGRQRESRASREAMDARARLDPHLPVLELGCGLGADALFLADSGFDVIAVDRSRPAIVHARTIVSADGAAPEFLRVNMSNQREVMTLARRIARAEQPVQVYARHFVECLSPLGIDVTLTFLEHLLRAPGSRALLFSRAPDRPADVPSTIERLSDDALLALLPDYGLRGERVVRPAGSPSGHDTQYLIHVEGNTMKNDQKLPLTRRQGASGVEARVAADAADVADVEKQISELRLMVTEMQLTLHQLTEDLQESRHLNLRAADLLDMVYANVLSANVRGGDVRGADVRGADVRGADKVGRDRVSRDRR